LPYHYPFKPIAIKQSSSFSLRHRHLCPSCESLKFFSYYCFIFLPPFFSLKHNWTLHSLNFSTDPVLTPTNQWPRPRLVFKIIFFALLIFLFFHGVGDCKYCSVSNRLRFYFFLQLEVTVDRKNKDLKHLGFVRIAAIQTFVFVSNLYEYAKQNSGPLRSAVGTVENTVTTVLGPVCNKFKGFPDDVLVFVDKKVTFFFLCLFLISHLCFKIKSFYNLCFLSWIWW